MIKEILLLWRPYLEIAILWYAIYNLLVFFERTRARNVLRGLIILVVMFFIFQKLGFHTLDWIMTKIFAISIIGIFIIFQPELRQGLARLGARQVFLTSPLLKAEELEILIRQLEKAAVNFSEKKIGALIALERDDSLKVYIDSGVQMDSMVSEEILEAIFFPSSPLHDGGVVIVGGRIAAACCLFPLIDDNARLSRTHGTRHRAALGLSEDTDAVVIIVSEETGNISLATEGHIISDISREELSRTLRNLLRQET
ncbi:MAG: diadenylate cyclase CdaA [Candidatus Omnitrophica bacterium]|nr:diadenylate cyclase CdaA [Candidatus Omnitrophota bacterium]MDD5352563.1 diadenylate cyclase CdaA [Candidatus Omnitrophota bacterium]MDD5550161.1 diadenylate cyclase CdaA [Candidatus Omnitrophota bacterium]